MKVLVTGANGFVGQYLVKLLLEKGHEVIATGKGESRLSFEGKTGFNYVSMDFTDPFSVHDVFNEQQPKAVVHLGAMSKPDDCERDQWQAYVTNVEGTITLLLNAEEQKAFFLFLSTDFVFDGEKGMYTEEDLPAPVSFYGRTKLEAEQAVQEYEHGWAIARTVLVYGKAAPGRNTLLSIIKNKLEKGESYKVVNDQLRTPTYVEDLTAGLVSILEKKAGGIFHLSGEEVLTPYEMASRAAVHLGLDASLLEKVTADVFVEPAKRPLKTGFNISKAKTELGYTTISFEEGLMRTFD